MKHRTQERMRQVTTLTVSGHKPPKALKADAGRYKKTMKERIKVCTI